MQLSKTKVYLIAFAVVATLLATIVCIPAQQAEAASSPSISYKTHVQKQGWQGWKKDGATSGTSGKSLRLEGIYIKLNNKPVSGSIQYRVHVQNQGWQGWKNEGQMAGTTGKSLRLEAIQIRLTGKLAEQYDVQYRVHAQNFGWLYDPEGYWARNGEKAGTAGFSFRLEGIQIKLVKKNLTGVSDPAKNWKNEQASIAEDEKVYSGNGFYFVKKQISTKASGSEPYWSFRKVGKAIIHKGALTILGNSQGVDDKAHYGSWGQNNRSFKVDKNTKYYIDGKKVSSTAFVKRINKDATKKAFTLDWEITVKSGKATTVKLETR